MELFGRDGVIRTLYPLHPMRLFSGFPWMSMDADGTSGIALELVDMGTEEGGSFPIHNRMYEAIASSDIIICDLTGHRPNVYIEAGYALKHHEGNRLIFLFEPSNAEDQVPFDLNIFKYVAISQAAEIPNKVLPELKAILKASGAQMMEEGA